MKSGPLHSSQMGILMPMNGMVIVGNTQEELSVKNPSEKGHILLKAMVTEKGLYIFITIMEMKPGVN